MTFVGNTKMDLYIRTNVVLPGLDRTARGRITELAPAFSFGTISPARLLFFNIHVEVETSFINHYFLYQKKAMLN